VNDDPQRRAGSRGREEAARVVLADDHVATRAGVRLALEGKGFTIVAEVGTGEAAVEEAVRHRPDLCLLDLYMPGGGIPAAERIHAELPETKIVVLTVSPNERDLFEAVLAGASGYILKDASPARLPLVLRGVLAGEGALPRNFERRLIEEFRARELSQRHRRRFMPRRRGLSAELTTREWEVLELISDRLPTTVIAQRLGISEVTVRRHISSVMHKLDVPNRASAARLLSRDAWPEGWSG
jgi:two-component system NarL family response regulator